jgi:hypothetical protein
MIERLLLAARLGAGNLIISYSNLAFIELKLILGERLKQIEKGVEGEVLQHSNTTPCTLNRGDR